MRLAGAPSTTIKRVSSRDARLRSFLAMHYRTGHVRCLAGVWLATCDGLAAGAMWVAFPVLNGAWRDVAWPDAPRGKACRARWLNANVRTIARVIVEPRFRGCGVATALVRSYLQSPLSPRTEALAAMGHASPFFARAGMREVSVQAGRDARLREALAREGVPAWRLCDTRAASAMLSGGPCQREGLRHAVLAWARASKSTARHAQRAGQDDALLVQLGMLAAGHVCGGVRVYVAGGGDAEGRASDA